MSGRRGLRRETEIPFIETKQNEITDGSIRAAIIEGSYLESSFAVNL